MKVHKLKCWPEYFQAVRSGAKTFEFRKDDRPYEVGDILQLQEYDPATALYTEDELFRRVTYCARGNLIPQGLVVMSMERTYDPGEIT